MTQNKRFKNEVREYAAKHGLAYADARRRLLEARRTAAEEARLDKVTCDEEH